MVEYKNSLVYLYGFSLRKEAQLGSLVTILNEQISAGIKLTVVLMHDGVIGISKKGTPPSFLIELFNLPIEINALIPDIKARGIDIEAINGKIHLIDYDELVDLLAETPKIISWL
jgi:sulfur relay protein TusB/DsrH